MLALVSVLFPLLLFSLRLTVAAVDLAIIYVEDNNLCRILITNLIRLLFCCIALLIVVGLMFFFFTNAILEHLQIWLLLRSCLAIKRARPGVLGIRLAQQTGIVFYRACGSEIYIRRVGAERAHLD